MKSTCNHQEPPDAWPLKIFTLAFGGFLGLTLLKFPNPPVVEHLISAPTNGWEWVLTAWPVRYANLLLGLLALAGLALMRWPSQVSKLPALLPLAWLLWVGLSATQTIDPAISRLTMIHFGLCLVCFYLGLLVVGRLRQAGWLFAGLIAAFLIVLATGLQQHFGGLDASRQNFWLYVYPTLTEPPSPELLKRMESKRIFSTLFYANSLAGALILLTPSVLGIIADAKNRFTIGARWFMGVAVGIAAAGCLVWSGSKAGWLLALGMGVVVLLRLPVKRQIKMAVILGLVIVGTTGFFVRYAGFFKRGAPSVVQRFNYWHAALQNVQAHPMLGSGPGTFATVYKRVKPPDAEMARLTHNDYLQQASDSGVIAGLLLLGIVVWVVFFTRSVWSGEPAIRSRRREEADSRVVAHPPPHVVGYGWGRFGVWLGLMGFGAQAVVEFGFYVPATAWCWFALAGWLVAQGAPNSDSAISKVANV